LLYIIRTVLQAFISPLELFVIFVYMDMTRESTQIDRAMHEKELTIDLSTDFFSRLLHIFPTTEYLLDELMAIRNESGLIDMKRGELYPEVIAYSSKLREVLATVYEVDLIQAQPNFGCNGCIDSFLSYTQKLVLTGEKYNGFLAAVPTYFRYYQKAEALGLNLHGIPFESDGSYPVVNIIAATRETNFCFLLLVTPNNPTGVPISDNEIEKILNEVSENLIVVIDRTCVNIDPEISTKDLLKKFSKRNLVIFHSFSKYHSLSHQRIGFTLVSNKKLAEELNSYTPFGLNLYSVFLATNILLSEGQLRPGAKIRDHIKRNSEIMTDFLKKNSDYACSSFKSNYAVLKIPAEITTQDAYQRLLEKGISVMPGHELPVKEKQSLRIHCGGPPEQFDFMLQEMANWQKKAVPF